MICAPVPRGNGAHVVHAELARHLPGYRVADYDPWWTLFPPALARFGCGRGVRLLHAPPDHAVWLRRRGAPWVVTFHGYMLDPFMRRYCSALQSLHYRTDLRWFTRMAARRATALTAVSRFTADLARRDLDIDRPIRVIHNGVDESRFRPVRRDRKGPFRVLFVGTPNRRKGGHWLRPIADRLQGAIEILYTQGLRGGAVEFDHPRLRSLGSVAHARMPDVYGQADLLLFPSVREGFGLAVAEAMACGLPVVATDGSSLPELVVDGKGGTLCPLGDVEAFADAIQSLADAPQRCREMGEFNRARVESRFTLRQMLDAYRSLFESLLDRAERGGPHGDGTASGAERSG